MTKEAKFRQFLTENNVIVIAGKNKESNEELVKQVNGGNLVLHTDKPGSPFCEIKGTANKEDIEQASVFCAKYSQDWRDNKKDVKVHIFLGRDISKKPGMEIGTFSVSRFKEIVVKKEKIKEFEEELKEVKEDIEK